MFICECHHREFKSQKALSGHLGQIASQTPRNNSKQNRRDIYMLNPTKCLNCETLLPYERKKEKFCDHSCSAIFTNTNRKKKDTPLCLVCSSPCKTKYETFCSSVCSGIHRMNQNDKLIEEGLVTQRKTLRNYLIRKNGYECQTCHKTEWLSQPIPLELNHINGRADDNSLSNLEVICPNCHALTSTYKAKNKGNGRKSLGLPLH